MLNIAIQEKNRHKKEASRPPFLLNKTLATSQGERSEGE
jgi:hypothetical protein